MVISSASKTISSIAAFSGRSTILPRRRRNVLTVASSPGMPATTVSPGSADVLLAHHDVVAVEDAGVDHRVAADPEHEQRAVAGEVLGEGEGLLDVLGREHAGAGGDVAHERHVARRAGARRRHPSPASKHTSIARGLVGSRRRKPLSCSAARWAWTVVLDERPDGLADLPDAGRVAPLADLGGR